MSRIGSATLRQATQDVTVTVTVTGTNDQPTVSNVAVNATEDGATVSGSFGVLGFLVHAWLAGGFIAAVGSEGMGLAHGVPIPAVVLYLIGIAAGIWYVLPKPGVRPLVCVRICIC